MLAAVIIAPPLSLVVCIALIPTIISLTKDIDTTSPGLNALINVLPFIFVAVIILGAIAWMSYTASFTSKPHHSDDFDNFSDISTPPNTPKTPILPQSPDPTSHPCGKCQHLTLHHSQHYCTKLNQFQDPNHATCIYLP